MRIALSIPDSAGRRMSREVIQRDHSQAPALRATLQSLGPCGNPCYLPRLPSCDLGGSCQGRVQGEPHESLPSLLSLQG